MYCRRLFKIIPTKRWVSNNYWKYWDYGCMGLTRSLQPICRTTCKIFPHDLWPRAQWFLTSDLSLLTRGYWTPVPGRWALEFLAPDIWLLSSCRWPLGPWLPGPWPLATNLLSLALDLWLPGPWPLATDLLSLAFEQLTSRHLTSCPWPLASDLFSQASGFWPLLLGLWLLSSNLFSLASGF